MCYCQSKQKGRMTLKLSPPCVWACLSVSVCLCDSEFDFYSRRFNLIVYADSDFDLYFLCSDNVWVARPDMTFEVDWTFKTNYLSVSICVCVTGEYPHLSKCFLSYTYSLHLFKMLLLAYDSFARRDLNWFWLTCSIIPLCHVTRI